ncbi:TPA: class I SAM-dependent methyltransferase [Legionella pneumophila]
MQSKQDLNINEWLSAKSRESLKDAVRNKIFNERRERVIKDPESKIDYGYTFPGLNCVRENCLKEIREYFSQFGVRPLVADIGAGLGTMTWKLLVAGAQVDAFEIQKPSAEELLKRIKQVNPYFWEEDELDDILHVYPENALDRLDCGEFKEKYDFIWMSQVLHFLTPKDIIRLKSILQHVLKPGGKVFIEANTYYTFQSLDEEQVILSAYNEAKKKGLEFPGFLAINGATLTDHTLDKMVQKAVVSAFDEEQMAQYSIPYETNGYGQGYLGPQQRYPQEDTFNQIKEQNPLHIFTINRFHQVMNFIDEETAPIIFEQHGFKCTSYLFNAVTNEILKRPIKQESYCLLAVYLDKMTHSAESSQNKIPPLVGNSLFNSDFHSKLVLELEQVCKNKEAYLSFFDAIKVKDYGLALRKASAVAQLDFVKIILKYRTSLNIQVDGQSKNGYTALDWINSNKTADYMTKERIVSLLNKHDVQSALGNNTPSSKC